MADHHHGHNGLHRHDDVRFEHTDVNINPIVGFLVVLGVALTLAMVALWAWHQSLDRREKARKQPANPMAVERSIPPEPRIEGLKPGMPGYEMSHSVNKPNIPASAAAQRAREGEALKKGWKDAQGKWHPPIDVAMKRVVEAAGKKAEEKK